MSPPGDRAGLSVVVITRDEEANIGACLDSVRWADEIVVLDSGSTDATAQICRERGAQVEVSDDWPGFGVQKNRAIALATREWILSLDADERVTPELRREIEAVLARPRAEVYEIPRLSWYLGRPMRHGDWWPDLVPRLFRRGRAHFSEDVIHERLLCDRPPGRLRHPLEHRPFTDLEQVLDKLNRYSSLSALRLEEAGRRGGLIRALGNGLWSFFRGYVLRRGFLDGRQGFILAVSNAEGVYYKYLKLAFRRRP